MHIGFADFSKDIKYINSSVSLNLAEMSILNKTAYLYYAKKSFIVCYPNDELLIPLLLNLFHNDYDCGYVERDDYGRRLSILIFTDLSYGREVFDNLKVSTQYIISNSIQKQQFYTKSGRDNYMDDTYNAQSYWKDIFIKKYGKNNIPEYIDYKDVFPICIGYDTFNVLSRNYFGHYDNSQQAVFYLTSNCDIFNNDIKFKFDCICVDYSKINKYIKKL